MGVCSKVRTFNQTAGVEMIELPTEWPVGPVNVFLIYGEKLTLVDCGRKLEKAWGQFNASLKQRGLTIMDIEQIVLTHHHDDHIGFLDWILEKNPIPVYAHANCRPYLTQDVDHFQRGAEFFSTFYREFGIPKEQAEELANSKAWNQGLKNKIQITMELDGGVAIPGLSEWQVIETKGHAQSHISLYRSSDHVLLCGDHLIKHSPAGIFLEAPIFPETERSNPLIQYVNNLKKCLSFPVDITLSGHGEAIQNLPELINETLQKIDKRAGRVKSKLVNRKKSGFDLVKELYPDRFEDAMILLASDTIGLLDLLFERGEIISEKRDGVIYYSV
ncbi:MBL fold metallo-hydrolase [Peribacillus cavernae]|uniref:MBL fold metallo-hydrolase n=1 Tax=Peribacillus cavernae TaxID=1674310 RepID=A0A3S0TZT4_9BACI|nr:MBL fold metallo-hydrolase [Peribacillus cavernae]MDQ0217702.1 glyoxylase-like metal-dependent hydrolase (beta-lactamase superfamily II) [Peribacillus cavernae]RUQ28170.1 MBL fold metallo-hydrolase [Peribacillus cavernae]